MHSNDIHSKDVQDPSILVTDEFWIPLGGGTLTFKTLEHSFSRFCFTSLVHNCSNRNN